MKKRYDNIVSMVLNAFKVADKQGYCVVQYSSLKGGYKITFEQMFDRTPLVWFDEAAPIDKKVWEELIKRSKKDRK